MKKIISYIISVVLLITMNATSFAQGLEEVVSYSYEKTFSSADSQSSLEEEGYTFSTTPTLSDNGLAIASRNYFTFTPNTTIGDHYYFETQAYKGNSNSYLLKFNVTDSGYYALYLNQSGTFSGPDFSFRLKKFVGTTEYNLAVDEFNSGSSITYCNHAYTVDVSNTTDGVKIVATCKNLKNNDSLSIEYLDTDSDVGYDEIDNGAPLSMSGVITMAMQYASASYMSYLNMYAYTMAEPEEPNLQSSVLCLENDRDPYTGVLTTIDAGTSFTFDTAYSSLGLDLETSTEINNIILVDGDESNRIHRADLSLYVSDDNIEYTRIKDFTATKVGGRVYLYNFTANARYVKVHCHHGVPLQEYMMAESFINTIDDMMSAQNVVLPAGGGGTFEILMELQITPEVSMLDGVAFVDNDVLADVSTYPLRFVLDDGYVLSHYKDDSGVYIRIPEAVSGETFDINVYGGNKYAAELSDMNSVFEVTYGNKTAYHLSNGDFFRANITVGEAPNGDVLLIANDKAITKLHVARSTDGGRTWSEPEVITDRSFQGTNDGGGLLTNYEDGKMYYFGHFGTLNSGYTPGLLVSTDNGHTWSEEPYIAPQNQLMGCVYDNGMIAKSYDGDGPDIDYVFSHSSFNSPDSGSMAGVIFSRDNGRTWTSGPTFVNYWPEDAELAWEAGVSESSIVYQSNGDMAMLSRNQWPDEHWFSQSVSHDDGFTWNESAWRSSVWSSNGGPNLKNLSGDKEGDILLLWPANTNAATNTYTRYPLSIAYSTDDMVSWTNKMSVWEGTTYGLYNSEYDRSYATQPGYNPVSYKDSDDMFIFWTHHGSGNGVTGASSIDGILVEDFEDYLYKTKGAAEDFESDDAKYENWFQMKAKTYPNASVTISSEMAKTGSKSLNLCANGSILMANRSVPQIMAGEVSFDMFVDSISTGYGVYIDFKPVFNASPLDGSLYSMRIDKDGNIYILQPDEKYSQSATSIATLDISQWNNIKIKFDRANDVAKLYINGVEAADMIINSAMPKVDGLCFIQFGTAQSSQIANIYIDNFMAYEGVKMNAVEK